MHRGLSHKGRRSSSEVPPVVAGADGAVAADNGAVSAPGTELDGWSGLLLSKGRKRFEAESHSGHEISYGG